jgi:hypothetical protein
LRFLPPFTITEKETSKALRILGRLFKQGDGYWKAHQSGHAAAA